MVLGEGKASLRVEAELVRKGLSLRVLFLAKAQTRRKSAARGGGPETAMRFQEAAARAPSR